MLMLMMSMMIMMMMEIRLGEKAKKRGGGDLDKHVTKLAGCMEAKSF